MPRKKPVASFQIDDFPQAAILLFKAHDLLGYAQDQIRPMWNEKVPESTASLAPDKRKELGSDLFRYDVELHDLLIRMLKAHGIPARKGWERLHKLRRQIRATG
ncbi:hypothetical protein IAD21_01216 [Abditibacteriota bacterium]|nr:hypothetical protein IAD21_01216 [Abditibacteriota bacterium]